ncbi:MAG: four helix bundle protein [Acidobacteria bacterium]|nr:MAG: four helix bundle protein [Acidobacteriota bacterium]
MKSITPVDLETRTTDFALRVIKLYSALPKTTEAQVLGKQLLRSGTSVGAHYREAKRAKSALDFISKIEGALQELDETCYWLELIERSGLMSARRLISLQTEAVELTKILVTVAKRAKEKTKK